MSGRLERVTFEELTGLGTITPGQIIKVVRKASDPPLRVVVREVMRTFNRQGYEVSPARLYNSKFRRSPDEYYLVVTGVDGQAVKEVSW